MKTYIRVITCVVFITLLVAVPSALAQADKLVGVWQLSEVIYTGPNARTVKIPPNVQTQITIFTKKYMTIVGIRDQKPRPELPENATDAQKVAAWEPVHAVCMSYEVKGTTIIFKAIILKNPNVKPGDTMLMDYHFEGDTLVQTIKSDKNGPVENPYTIKYIRLE